MRCAKKPIRASRGASPRGTRAPRRISGRPDRRRRRRRRRRASRDSSRSSASSQSRVMAPPQPQWDPACHGNAQGWHPVWAGRIRNPKRVMPGARSKPHARSRPRAKSTSCGAAPGSGAARALHVRALGCSPFAAPPGQRTCGPASAIVRARCGALEIRSCPSTRSSSSAARSPGSAARRRCAAAGFPGGSCSRAPSASGPTTGRRSRRSSCAATASRTRSA